MRITLVPPPRRIDRGPQAKRHVGPYYGHDLRRVLSPEPTDASFIERLAEWWETVPNWAIWTGIGVVIGACAIGMVIAV